MKPSVSHDVILFSIDAITTTVFITHLEKKESGTQVSVCREVLNL